jgi:MerR family transcriptional regulator, light-induced transcriptional regulator
MGASLNIAALTRRTGVPPDTIRKWEQRYGVLQPERTPGGQRRYSEVDVARVEWLKARLAEGYRIGEAAALLGSAERGAANSPAELRTALLEAVRGWDVDALGRLVAQALTVHGTERAFLEILAPALVEVGTRWEAGDLTVGQEHLASGVVRASLERLIADARPTVRGVAVLACAPGEQHEIGLLMLAVLLRADGWNVAYLGPDTPVVEAVRVARSLNAAALCFSVSDEERAQRLETALETADVPDGLAVEIGGRGVLNRVTVFDSAQRLRGATV